MSMIVFAAYLLACSLIGMLGRGRVIGFWGFFALAFFFSPLVGLAVALITAPKKAAA